MNALKGAQQMFYLCLTLLCTVLLSTATSADQETASKDDTTILNIGSRRQIFMDGRFLAKSSNVDLIVHPPQKTDEHTIVPQQPWEPYLGSHISALKMGDTYHLWYTTRGVLCYARSQDGIHYEKPDLGLAHYEGSTHNNIVVGHGAGGLFRRRVHHALAKV